MKRFIHAIAIFAAIIMCFMLFSCTEDTGTTDDNINSNGDVGILEPGTDKGETIRRIAALEGIPMENVMAFGDNTNDQTMLNAVGWPCAVENAVESLKESAKIVTPPCEADGVAQTIEKALRGEIG